MGRNLIDVTGKIFGDFIVNKMLPKTNSRHIKWEFSCVHCGKTKDSSLCNIRRYSRCSCQKEKSNVTRKMSFVRHKKHSKFKPDHQVIKDATKEYFKNGGKITKYEIIWPVENSTTDNRSIQDEDIDDMPAKTSLRNGYISLINMSSFHGRF